MMQLLEQAQLHEDDAEKEALYGWGLLVTVKVVERT